MFYKCYTNNKSLTVGVWHFLLLFLMLFSYGKCSASVVTLPDSVGSCLIGNNIEYFDDTTNLITIEKILEKSSPVSFTPCTELIQSYGISTSSLWTRFLIHNPYLNAHTYYFEISDAYFNTVEIYRVVNGVVSRYHTGIDQPFKNREVFDRNFVFALNIPPADTLSVYVKLKSRSSKELPYYLYNETSFKHSKIRESLLLGMFYGILIVFICINIALFILLKDFNYLLYVSVIATFGLFQGILDGFLYMYAWPDFPVIQKYSFHCFALLSVLCGLLFGVRFLFPKFADLPFKKVFYLLLIAIPCLITYSFFGSVVILGNALSIVTISAVLYIYIIALISYKNKYHPARYYLMAWTIFLICICIRVLACSGIIPYFSATFYSIHAGILAQVFLTSIALGDRLRIVQKQNETDRMKASEYKQSALELQLANLQAQIKPHFLFNTINSITNLVITQPKLAEEALVELSAFYRQTLSHSSRVIVSLKEEVDFLTLYLKLEKMKFGKRLTFDIDISPDYHQLQIPFMTLQLLVENSIKHGIHPRPSGGNVSIRTESQNNLTCKLIVEDNGIGLRKNSYGNGYGIQNVKKGLCYIYGDEYSFLMEDKKSLMADSESGVRVSIDIPCKTDRII